MATRSVATVIGGSGFIGRYVVKRLAHAGYIVRVGGRSTEAARVLRPMGAVGQVVPLYCALTDPATIARAVDGAELVVNLVGILAEPRPGAFQKIQAEGPAHIARAATASGVRAMVHVSAIGADPASPSLYGRTKAEGEAGVRAAFPAATILRPSLVFGPEDAFFNRFAAMAQMLPVMPVICGDTRMQPVYVGDVADAVMAAFTRPDARGVLYELGGPRVWTFRQLLSYILQVTQRSRRLLEIPLRVAQLQARLAELLPTKPFTRDQLMMLSRDNVVAPGMPGLAELGLLPTPVELVVPEYLAMYRKGGGKKDLAALLAQDSAGRAE